MMVHPTGEKREVKKPGMRPVLTFFAVLACIVAAAIVAGVLPRLTRQKGLLAAAEVVTNQKPVVIASPAKYASSKDSIDLPGDLQAIIESPIFARADGYLVSRKVDIGYKVKAGQLMAEIETPELDQQIIQARATLAQSQSLLKELQADIELAKANLNMSKLTRDRWDHLATKGAVSKQEHDEKQADFDVKQAQANRAEATLATAQDTVRATDANLRRLEQLKGFASVLAPFDGIVTARNMDVGTLINAGNDGNTKEIFRVAKLQPMRIFVNVPQTYVEEIHQGQLAELRVQEKPGVVYPAHVSGMTNSLDAASRAMLVILQTPNTDGSLFPGMYAQVRFAASKAKPMLRVPGDTVMLTKNGPRVAVVGADHIVHFRNVTIGQDFGNEIEVASGLKAGEMVISNPADVVQEGAAVEVRAR
jgi:RND family efflux transporter MFP subunit